ncbi:MAG: chemotaxis response regulator protein-glutamate methylesterase [Planctomycetaceae bacterium]
MNNKTRVMLCDDSAVMRRLIKTAISSVPSLQVVFEARHGREAVDQIGRVKPDVIVMDVEMPVMDGIDTVREVRRHHRTLPVIMFSSLTSRGAEATLDAIAAGASDFATKPVGAGHVDEAMEHLRVNLIPKILQWRKPEPASPAVRIMPQPATKAPAAVPRTDTPKAAVPRPRVSAGPVSAIAIGVSTGGPAALAKLVDGLPVDLPVPILIAQHMPPVFTSLLAERLASQKGHAVREAADGEPVRPGDIFIAPGDNHMAVVRDKTTVRIALNQDAPEHSCRPAADQLFRSVADVYGSRALGVVLTGMGHDGTAGARALSKQGARILVQDEESSVVWGMPGAVSQEGLADQTIPLDQMASELLRHVRKPMPVA